MFFAPDRLAHMQTMILAETTAEREKALEKLLPMQREDFLEEPCGVAKEGSIHMILSI